jgi:hypothetical protein
LDLLEDAWDDYNKENQTEGCDLERIAEKRWQILYDTDRLGERFRGLGPDVKCTIKVNKLLLVEYLKSAPR